MLRGWTRNLADGRVEVVARGSAEQLAIFEAKLRQGPPSGRVEAVSVAEVDAIDLPDEFEVRKDGTEPWK